MDDPTDHGPAATAKPRPLEHLTDAQLDDHLASLAGHLAATQASLLAHVLEMDFRGLWAQHGARSSAEYLSWRLGLGLVTAREYVRVAYALLDLPNIAAAFAQGRLSYSKVRALARVATPSTEHELLGIALDCTGAQMERIARVWRRSLVAEDSTSAYTKRRLERDVQDDGSVVFRLRVPADDAGILDRALEVALRSVLDEQGRPVETAEESTLARQLTEAPPAARARADAMVLLAESFLAAGGPTGDRGDGTEVVLHAELADIIDLVRPTVDAERTATCTHRATTRSVDGHPLPAETALRRMCESSTRVMAHAPDGRPVDLGRSVRHASTRQRRLLHDRDPCCRFPGCTQRRWLIPHHVSWWSRGGSTDLDNLVMICPAHHRAVHEVGYRVIARGQGRFTFTTPAGAEIGPAGASVTDVEPEHDAVASLPWSPPPLPTWVGERLDLGLLIDSMVANTLIAAGHRLPDLPISAVPRALREATGWPHSPRWPRNQPGAA